MSTATDHSDELLVGFIDESINAIQELPEQLGEHRGNPADRGQINSVFRAVHSIKGNAGFFGLTAIKKFSHSLENTLDEVRNGTLRLVEDLERSIVEGFDILDEMLQRVLEGTVDAELGQQETELLGRVEELAGNCRVAKSEEELRFEEACALAEEITSANLPQSEQWAQQVRALACFEEQTEDQPDDEQPAVPTPDSFVDARFRLGQHDVSQQVAEILELFLATQQGRYTDEIGQKFLDSTEQFAAWAEKQDQSSISSLLRSAAADFKTIYESPFDMDATLVSIAWDQLGPELAKLLEDPSDGQKAAGADAGQSGEIGPQEGQTPAQADSAAEDQSQPGRGKSRLIRIKEERLDDFIDDVSSLFITCERLKDVHARMANQEFLRELVEELRQINGTFSEQANALQHSVVALRKVPIRGLLSKFPRLARSLATNLGKKINVHISGEDTEVDKALAEDLDAPLTHMIRNVADHAIETPEERIQRGLEEAGNLWLHAEQTRTHVTLTVRDDGRGIDPDRLRKKIVEKEILTQAQADALSEQEAIELIFHPGFSTAEKVSDVSGRGVGMDVVRTNIREHDGEVKVQSQVGVGTTFHLEIPIRQAVLVVDGLLLKQDRNTFVLPFDNILEICEFEAEDLKTVQGSYVADIRGKTYAAVSLGELLGLGQQPKNETEAILGILIGSKTGSLCLLADHILGQRKVVINGLEDILPGTEKVTGVAQLGAGQLALVLSAADLVNGLKQEQDVSTAAANQSSEEAAVDRDSA